MSYVRFVVPVNPVPWKTPPFSVGRGKGGKQFVRAGRDQELAAYQESLREHISADPECRLLEPPYMIQLWFSRRQDNYASESGRKSKQHEADATNMQKATEDALQDLIITNDSQVPEVYSHIIEQGPEAQGLVIIEVWGNWEMTVPRYIADIYLHHQEQVSVEESDNAWPPMI